MSLKESQKTITDILDREFAAHPDGNISITITRAEKQKLIHQHPPIDLLYDFEHAPPPLDFIWSGFLTGTVGALIAPGATGKSFFALQAAMSVAGYHEDADLLNLKPKHYGKVLYLAAEDPKPILSRRIHSIGKYLTRDAQEMISENLCLQPIMGEMTNLVTQETLTHIIKQGEGCRLIILDTLSRLHRLDENSNSDMALLVSILENIAKETGASVLYLHHTSKSSARDGQLDQQQAARGASALIDNARWCGYIAKMTEKEAEDLSEDTNGNGIFYPIKDKRYLYARFGISKQNYDLIQKDTWYKRQDGGVLIPADILGADERKQYGKKEKRERRRDDL